MQDHGRYHPTLLQDRARSCQAHIEYLLLSRKCRPVQSHQEPLGTYLGYDRSWRQKMAASTLHADRGIVWQEKVISVSDRSSV